MAKRIDVDDVNVYYSDFLAVEGASINIAPLSVTAFIGPSGCGKSTFLRILNRMHEVIPGGRVSGTVHAGRRGPLRPGRRSGERPPHRRHGVPEGEPVPDDVDLRQRHRRVQDRRHPEVQERAGRHRRALAAGRQPVGRGQAATDPARRRACPAVSSNGCASPGRSPSNPRCC